MDVITNEGSIQKNVKETIKGCFFFISYFLLESLEVSLWTINDVANFVKRIPDVDEADVQVLVSNKISGRSLMKLTVDKLMQDGIPRGPAENIFEEIQKLQKSHYKFIF